MNIILETSTHKIESEGVVDKSQVKKVKWLSFESELPDAIINELENIRNRTTPTNKNVLKAVIVLINDMNSDKEFNAFGGDIADLLTKMVATNLITLDQDQADAILTELQS